MDSIRAGLRDGLCRSSNRVGLDAIDELREGLWLEPSRNGGTNCACGSRTEGSRGPSRREDVDVEDVREEFSRKRL
jgi:hypothetical protein